MNKQKTGLSSPWVTYSKKIMAIFERDKDLTVNFDQDTYTITIESENTFKIMAIEKILEPQKVFGNITVTVKCLVKNAENESVAALFKTAFAGNPIVSQIQEVATPLSPSETYVIFKKEVIQFFNDDTSDFYGNFNGLSEDIMRDVVNGSIRVNFGTEKDEEE